MTGGLWSIVTVFGPILFLSVLLYAVLRNRFQKNKPPREVSEEGAKRLRRQVGEDRPREKSSKEIWPRS